MLALSLFLSRRSVLVASYNLATIIIARIKIFEKPGVTLDHVTTFRRESAAKEINVSQRKEKETARVIAPVANALGTNERTSERVALDNLPRPRQPNN